MDECRNAVSSGEQPLVTALADVSRSVQAIVSEVLEVDVDRIGLEQSLLELGAESFDFVTVVHRVEQTLGVELPLKYAIPGRQTVEEYARAVLACRTAAEHQAGADA